MTVQVSEVSVCDQHVVARVFFHLCSHENVDFCSTGEPLYFKILKSLVLILDRNVLNQRY